MTESSNTSALAEELREYTALKYAGDCKCGKCQLVPRELVDRIYAVLASQQGGEKAEASAQDATAREALAETIHKARWPADRQLAVTPFADEDRSGREYCFRIADAVLASLASRSPADIAPAIWNDGYQAKAVEAAKRIQERRHSNYAPSFQEKLLLADALMQALGVVEQLRGLLTDIDAVDAHGYRVAPMGYALQLRIKDALALSSTVQHPPQHRQPEGDA